MLITLISSLEDLRCEGDITWDKGKAAYRHDSVMTSCAYSKTLLLCTCLEPVHTGHCFGGLSVCICLYLSVCLSEHVLWSNDRHV